MNTTMNTARYFAFGTSLFLLVACGGSGESAETKNVNDSSSSAVESTRYIVDPGQTTVKWNGTMLGLYNHYGTVDLISGTVDMAEGKVVGGDFVIDMTTIRPLDENFDEEGTPEKLIGHLSSDEFFAVQSNPTASLSINGQVEDVITVDLTVRGETFKEEISGFRITKTDEGITGKGSLTFDRTKYGVAWVHPVKEKVLSDEIRVDVIFTAVPE